MATSTATFEINDRVIVTNATAGFPAGQLGTVVGVYWQGVTGTESLAYVVRVPDDVHGNFDMHLAAGDFTSAETP